jgi:hypothetical protein
MVPSVASETIPSDTTGIDPETFRLAAQCFNHYATPGPPPPPKVVVAFRNYVKAPKIEHHRRHKIGGYNTFFDGVLCFFFKILLVEFMLQILQIRYYGLFNFKTSFKTLWII